MKDVTLYQQNWKKFVIFITERILNQSCKAVLLEFPSCWKSSNARLLYRKKHDWEATDGIPDIFYGRDSAWEHDETPQAIIFMGLQASGKSTFCRQKFGQGYIRINLDSLHTRNKEARLLEECLQNRVSFVVDNTNPTMKERKRYIEAARAHGYRVEGYFFQSVVKDCVERNSRREGKACVPSKAIAFTSNRLEIPSYGEGYDKLYFVHIKDGEFMVDQWNEEMERKENDGF